VPICQLPLKLVSLPRIDDQPPLELVSLPQLDDQPPLELIYRLPPELVSLPQLDDQPPLELIYRLPPEQVYLPQLVCPILLAQVSPIRRPLLLQSFLVLLQLSLVLKLIFQVHQMTN
jgi:hypothetical protein